MKMFVSANNYSEYISPYYSTQPALSISMTGCMENGKDAVQGGCKYNSYGGTATGLATLADSLSTIKYMCFDKKKCTTRELYDAVMANWEGREILRQQVLNEVPHYGNADPYVDMELKWCVESILYDLQGMLQRPSKVYKSGLYGAPTMSRRLFDLGDARRQEVERSDRRRDFPGAVERLPMADSRLRLLLLFDHHHYLGGIALNLRMHPSVLSVRTASQSSPT